MSDKKTLTHPPSIRSLCIDLGIPFNQFLAYDLFDNSEKKHFADTDDLSALIFMSIKDKDRLEENISDSLDAIVELCRDRDYQEERIHILEQFESIVRRIFDLMVAFDFFKEGKLVFNCVYFQQPDAVVFLNSPIACNI